MQEDSFPPSLLTLPCSQWPFLKTKPPKQPKGSSITSEFQRQLDGPRCQCTRRNPWCSTRKESKVFVSQWRKTMTTKKEKNALTLFTSYNWRKNATSTNLRQWSHSVTVLVVANGRTWAKQTASMEIPQRWYHSSDFFDNFNEFIYS